MTDSIINISVDEAVELVGAGAFLLDVREMDEWNAGRAPQAAHVPLGTLPDNVSVVPKDSLIVCVCRGGVRSARAAAFLSDLGYETRNLDGGMQAWAAAGYPLKSDEGEPEVI